MKHLKIFSLFVLLVITNPVAARAIGSWRTHLAYNSVTTIAVGNDKVYAVSDGALFSVDKYNDSIKTYSKINGLSDNSVVNIAYSKTNNMLVVAYANGNLDLLYDDGQIKNVNDILRYNVNAAKNANDILFDGDFAYVSLPFGIVQLNLKRLEFGDTYIIGENSSMVDVKSMSVLNGYFYAVSANKIYKAPASGVNLANYANWETLDNLPIGENKKAIVYNSKLYLLQTDGKVSVLENGFWQGVYTDITNICANDGALFLMNAAGFFCQIGSLPSNIPMETTPAMAIYDKSISKIWVAATSEGVGLYRLSGILEKEFKPNGPASQGLVSRMKYFDGRIYGVSGGREWEVGKNNKGNVIVFENNQWYNITTAEIQNTLGVANCTDFTDIAIDKNDKSHYFVSSWGTGLYEFKNDQPFMRYHTGNSDIGSNVVYDLLFDNENKLWFTNSTANSVRYLNYVESSNTPNIKIYEPVNCPDCTWGAAFLQDNNNPNLKFVPFVRNTPPVLAFDNNGTLNDFSDDKYFKRSLFLDQEGKLIDNQYNFCAVQDKKGSIWIGTVGIVILPNTQNFFNENYSAIRPKMPRNDGSGLADYTLSTDAINSIAVDGDNQKWVGTKMSGVYLLNEDGTKELIHFTPDNSPLLSNNVYSIAINSDGEVFFGTDKGIISYQSTAVPPTPPTEDPKDKLHIFPNPVRENYHGPIAIKGLWENTVVKITDISGNLVYETISRGGMVTWDGNRRGGQRVSTGVYLVIMTTKDGKNHAVRKLLVIN
ncbi:MAG: hypothetical protein LBN95_03940 [Prevotellaceae bacterium]|jgi:hypothetical protein|nr:hypothetical protein [Prevotellaceae bacterium]